MISNQTQSETVDFYSYKTTSNPYLKQLTHLKLLQKLFKPLYNPFENNSNSLTTTY